MDKQEEKICIQDDITVHSLKDNKYVKSTYSGYHAASYSPNSMSNALRQRYAVWALATNFGEIKNERSDGKTEDSKDSFDQ